MSSGLRRAAPARTHRILRGLVAASLVALAACSDATTAPPIDPGDDPPASFAVEIPETITQGQAFPLTVTALDDAGLPATTWRGTVALTASDGTLAPASVELVNGTATVQVTLTGHTGDVTIQAANGGVQSVAVATTVLSGEAPARLEVVPAAALLTGAGATRAFTVRAYDAQGAPTTATQVTWTSNDAATLTIDAAGLGTAQSAVGSAMITASVNGVASAPVVVLVASPAQNAVLVPDSQIVSGVVPVDPAAPYEPGWQYRIRVTGTAPAVGDIVIGTGAQPLAGRVVDAGDVAGGETELTVELMPLAQLFTNLRIDENIPMIEQVGGTAPQSRGRGPAGDMPVDDRPAGFALTAETEFTLGRFTCTASGEVPSLDLPSPTLDIDPDLHLQIGYDNGLERLAVAGTVSADAGYKPVFEAKFTGEATCETVVKTFTIPANGILSWFYGVQVPLGFGFTLDGKLEIAEVGFDIKANATATVELGVSCPAGGACTGLDTFDMTRDGSLEFIAPDPSEQFRVELGAHAFVFARPYLGSLFTSTGSFEFVDATAGLKQSIDLATTHYQVEDTTYASSFNLQFLATIGAGKDLTTAIQSLGKLLGADLGASFNLVEIDDTLATSPKGTFTITPERVLPGDTTELGEMATFTVELDPVDYLGLYAVDKVEFFWKHEVEEDTTFTLGPGRPSCVDVASSSGQTTFECETDFLNEHEGEQTFHAFVHARLFGVPLPLPLEIAANAKATVDVSDCARPELVKVTTQTELNALARTCELLTLMIVETPGTPDPVLDLSVIDSLHLVGGIAIYGTTQITSLAGLEQVTLGPGATVILTGNTALASLDGLAAAAQSHPDMIGTVTIADNPVLSNISALSQTFGSAPVRGDQLQVSGNPMLTSLAGLEMVEVLNSLSITDSPALTSLSALSGLRELRVRANITNTGITSLGLPTLSLLVGDLDIFDNASLTAIDLVIDSVESPDYSNGIYIANDAALHTARITVTSGYPEIRFQDLPALTEVSATIGSRTAGLIAINQTGLETIAAFDVVSAEYLYIGGNPALADIEAFNNLTSVERVLMIRENYSLCVPDWVRDISRGSGSSVGDNSTDCP